MMSCSVAAWMNQTRPIVELNIKMSHETVQIKIWGKVVDSSSGNHEVEKY